MVPAGSDGGQPKRISTQPGGPTVNPAAGTPPIGDTVDVEDLLVARGLHKAYKNEIAVDGIDLTVTAGERVGLLGPNGAGKTTTLLMLLGAITPDQGEVKIAGCALPRQRSQAMEHVGFVAGYLPLPDRLRVREALDLFARFYGLRHPGPHIDAALERFRIPQLADRMCLELSSGQRTLVGICKAILHHPDLLVLDEPTASLDPDVAYRVRTGLADLCHEQGTALLVTSHDMGEVTQLCSRVVFLSCGRIVADGTPELIAAQFGHGSLEDVFLELAGTERIDASTTAPANIVVTSKADDLALATEPEAKPLARRDADGRSPSPAERSRAGDTASRRAGDTAR
jgi:ABC-2 type transport system ATP-binding protein